MAQIMKIDFTEVVRINEQRIFRVIQDLGEAEAADFIDFIDNTAHQISLRMDAISLAVNNGEPGQASREAEEMAQLAWQIGLISLARIAKGLATCAKQGNSDALPAIGARCWRIYNRSMEVVSTLHNPALRPSG